MKTPSEFIGPNAMIEGLLFKVLRFVQKDVGDK